MTGTDQRRELLSAYLDDQLEPAERREVEALLTQDADAEGELRELERVRRLLRVLPLVDPPRGFLEGVVGRFRTGRYRLYTGVAVLATATAWLAVVLVAPGFESGPVAPDLDELAAQHASAAADPMSGDAAVAGYTSSRSDAIDEPLSAPPTMGGSDLMAVYEDPADDVVQLVYGDMEEHTVAFSLFAQAGSVDWEAMPADGETMTVADERAWHGARGTSDLMVVGGDDVVYTLVAIPGDEDPDEVTRHMTEMAAEEMPEPLDPPVDDKMSDSLRGLLEAFGFG
ncbi:MAG: hypothetical protein JJLCMIEE_02774 [Acidimicrobiales bacterium]|nr:MAG: hypothetical protein EDR02_14735 [Actinomycetota bacterium]MBV6509678.1 hypothetical protein [Acidimicrobiales bacterium]RIK06367.1 MAG: hypothetical protein DCC48_08060 [Acidobacteriota bacterium]